MFIDEATITVSSGRGGDGVVTFRREKYVPRGGPDGGDGGRGGDVVLRAAARLNTLASVTSGRHYRAEAGRPGGPRQCHGRAGTSLVIEVPPGTIVRDAERGHVLRDLAEDGVECVVARGGDGGKGNKRFAHATNQTPRQCTPGGPGESRALRLELRLVADVGLVGLPNAGKSTLLRRTSGARPKVADYPFTTLEPVLGIVRVGHEDGFVVADIPGLIAGAHAGAGLGDRFLRHIARTRVLLHLVDAAAGPEAALAAWATVRDELRLSGLELHDKPSLLAVSRIDLAPDGGEAVAAALAQASGRDVVRFSSRTGAGVEELLRRLRSLLADRAEVRGKAGAATSSNPDTPGARPGSGTA